MNVKKWIGILVLICIGVVVVQVLQHVGQQTNLHGSLAAIMMDYNTVGEEGFRKKVAAICKSHGIEMDESRLRITEDRKANRVVLDLTYRKTLWVLFVPVERTINIHQEATLMEI